MEVTHTRLYQALAKDVADGTCQLEAGHTVPKVIGVALATSLLSEKPAEQAGKPLRLQSRPFGALFVLPELEKSLDTIGLIDVIVPHSTREKGPTAGEYFFSAWPNRLIVPRSKRALPGWYRHTAIQEIVRYRLRS